MSRWRARAIEMFPEMRSQVQSADSAGHFWIELISRFRGNYVHDEPNEPPAVIRAICLYAAWCAASESLSVREAASIEFYEYVPKFALGCTDRSYKRLVRDLVPNIGIAEVRKMGVSLDSADIKRFLEDAQQAEDELRRRPLAE